MCGPFIIKRGFPGVSAVKNSPGNSGDAGNPGWIPGSGKSLEKEMATLFRILAWKFQGQKSLAGYIQSMGSQRVKLDWAHTHSSLKGNPLVHVLKIYVSLSLFFPLIGALGTFLKVYALLPFHMFLGKFQSLEYFLAFECSWHVLTSV